MTYSRLKLTRAINRPTEQHCHTKTITKNIHNSCLLQVYNTKCIVTCMRYQWRRRFSKWTNDRNTDQSQSHQICVPAFVIYNGWSWKKTVTSQERTSFGKSQECSATTDKKYICLWEKNVSMWTTAGLWQMHHGIFNYGLYDFII